MEQMTDGSQLCSPREARRSHRKTSHSVRFSDAAFVYDFPKVRKLRKESASALSDQGMVDAKLHGRAVVKLRQWTESELGTLTHANMIVRGAGDSASPRTICSEALVESFSREAGEGQRQCTLCDVVMASARIKTHLTMQCLKSPYRVRVAYTCPRCACQFSNYSLLMTHLRQHSKAGDDVACSVCGKGQGSSEVKAKELPSLIASELSCEVCQAVLTSVADYMEHKKTHLDSEFGWQCEFCSKKYRSKGDLTYHQRTQHLSGFQLNCIRCGLGLRSEREARLHSCPPRNPITTARISLTNRVRCLREKRKAKEPQTVVVFDDDEAEFVSHDNNNKVVKLADMGGSLEASEELPVKSVPDPEASDEEEAEPGGALATLADAAARHPYACEFCGKGFKSGSGRHKHLKLMHGYKRVKVAKGPSTCCFCQRVFNSIYHLKEHIRAVHTDDEQFECDVCHKRYKSLKDRNYHKKTVHLGEFRYYCSECGKGLHSASRLKTHVCHWGQKQQARKQCQPPADPPKAVSEGPCLSRSWNGSKTSPLKAPPFKQPPMILIGGTETVSSSKYLVACWDDRGELVIQEAAKPRVTADGT